MKQKKILLIDDEDEVLDLMQEDLKDERLLLYTATDGKQALEILDRESIDCIISDIKMPELDGLKLLNRITESKHKEIPFFFMSSFPNLEKLVLDKDSIKGFIEKPYENADFLSLILKTVQLENKAG
ncbi:MAG: response regulator [Pseudobacteriovorax sp.]|nr:response regulator [Pseudobacteriovorax sp.]